MTKTEREELVNRLQKITETSRDITQLRHALVDAIAALTAQPQGEPSIWVRGYSIGFERPPAQHLHEWTPYYTAPQSGVREGMLKEALHVLVELKKIKRRIEAGTANEAETRYYNAMKESAWLGAESALSAAEQINAPHAEQTQTQVMESLADWHETLARSEQTHVSVPVEPKGMQEAAHTLTTKDIIELQEYTHTIRALLYECADVTEADDAE